MLRISGSDDAASAVYVRNKIAACEKTGIRSLHFSFAGDVDPAVGPIDADDVVAAGAQVGAEVSALEPVGPRDEDLGPGHGLRV